MIIVFGSLNIDMVMPVERLPQMGETVLCGDYISRPGGKGANQAVAAARAGAKVAMVGKVGDDSFGRRCTENLKRQGVMASGIGISERPTGCATIAVDSNAHNAVLVASGANMTASADQIPDEILTPRNTIVMQMEVRPEENWNIIARAYQRNARTILNASPAAPIPREVLSDVGFLIMNEVESLQIAHYLGLERAAPETLCRKMADLGDLACIITLGEKGAVAASGPELWQIGALDAGPVVDTTGAGDAFCGIFAAALERGDSFPVALHRASVGASLSCLELGAQAGIPFAEKIDEFLTKLAPARRL